MSGNSHSDWSPAGSALRAVPLVGYEAGGEDLWTHRLHLALAAEAIARRVEGAAWSRAYTIGLLMGVGKLALGQLMASRGESPEWLQAEALGMPFDRIESEFLGIDHAELGARLIWAWGMPKSAQLPIRFHHRPQGAPSKHQQTAFVVHLAHLVVTEMGHRSAVGTLDYAAQKEWE